MWCIYLKSIPKLHRATPSSFNNTTTKRPVIYPLGIDKRIDHENMMGMVRYLVKKCPDNDKIYLGVFHRLKLSNDRVFLATETS